MLPAEGLVAVAVETPQHAGLAATLDYHCERPLSPGTLVRVPLGKRHVPGVVWDRPTGAALAETQIKAVGDVLDAVPPLPDAWRQLVAFAAGYYQRSVGELALAVLPPELRKLDSAQLARRVARLRAAGPSVAAHADAPALNDSQGAAARALGRPGCPAARCCMA